MIRFQKVTLQNIEHKHHLIRKNHLTGFIECFVTLDWLVIESSIYRLSSSKKTASQLFFLSFLHIYMYYIHTFLGIHRVQVSDLRITNQRIGFAFSWITLSNFYCNLQIKTSLLLEFLSPSKPRDFCLHFKLDNLLISYFKKC